MPKGYKGVSLSVTDQYAALFLGVTDTGKLVVHVDPILGFLIESDGDPHPMCFGPLGMDLLPVDDCGNYIGFVPVFCTNAQIKEQFEFMTKSKLDALSTAADCTEKVTIARLKKATFQIHPIVRRARRLAGSGEDR